MHKTFGSAIADKIMNDAIDAEKSKELSSKMKELTDLQARIDQAIDSLPQGADRARLEAKRAEARGFFNQYVVPAYMAVYNLAKSVKGGSENAWDSITSAWNSLFSGGDFGSAQRVQYGMGAFFLPALPVGWVAASGIIALSGTALYYIGAQKDREMAILNDPAFTAEQKKALLEGGSLYGILGQAKWVIVAAAVGGIGYLYFKGKNQ